MVGLDRLTQNGPMDNSAPESPPKRHLDRLSRFFAGLTNVTNRYTQRHKDRPCYSICRNYSLHFMQRMRSIDK